MSLSSRRLSRTGGPKRLRPRAGNLATDARGGAGTPGDCGAVIYPPNVSQECSASAWRFVGGAGTPIRWPAIPNTWFHDKNPISLRVPEPDWPECGVCEYAPYLR